MSQLQFELWEECNSGCKFCYLGKANECTLDKVKLDNLQKTIDKLSDNSIYNDIDCLAYIGGEFFQGQLDNLDVRRKFFELMSKTNMLISQRKIREAWISASLIAEHQDCLDETVQIFDDKSKLWILTSYDTIGRFNTKHDSDIWHINLMKLRNQYPELKINITSILTEDFIDKYLTDSNELFTIAKDNNCQLFLKTPCSIDSRGETHLSKQETNEIIPRFFPHRHKFLEFLYKFKTLEDELNYKKLFDMHLRSDYLVKYGDDVILNHRIKDSSVEAQDGVIDVLPCGHSTQYAIYVDSDKCAICDKEMIWNQI